MELIKTKKKRIILRSLLLSLFALGIASLLPLAKLATNGQQKALFAVTSPFKLNKKSIDVDVSLIDAQSSKRMFGIDYLERGIQPIHLTVYNYTSNPYLVRPDQIDLPLIDVKKMVDNEGRAGRIGRSIFFRIIGFFFPPAAIPGTIESVLSSKAHSKFAHEVHAKAWKEETITPYSIVHRVVFVSDKALKDFTITFSGTETTETLVCNISIPSYN